MDSTTLFYLAMSYFCGAIPFGVIVAQRAGLGDIRQQGSGNIGATNVARVGSKKLGALVLALDALKGFLPVLLAARHSEAAGALAGLMAYIGHVFPVWLKFKGGKGVATGFGVMLGTMWPIALIAAGTWVAFYLWRKISSLGSVMACVSILLSVGSGFVMPWIPSFSEKEAYAICIMVLISLWRHEPNIRRLLSGQEGKV